ncbi:MAG: TetR/AcrR family transcriptional regulator [Sedimentitalea sp.]
MPTDTKTALLNSAEKAARTRGFDGFSYADLAQDVGIRKASIHHHFSTKAALSVALMKRYHQTLKAACAEIDAAHLSGAARVSALVDVYHDALQGGTSLCLCVSFSTSRESLPAEVIQEISIFRQMMLGWLGAAFATGKKDGSIAAVADPGVEAAAMLALLEGAQLAARAEENPKLFHNAIAVFKARLR